MTKDKLKFIRFSQKIVDPFPEHTEYNQIKNIFKFFRKRHNSSPKEISIWEAYKKGYDKAYSEIESSLE